MGEKDCFNNTDECEYYATEYGFVTKKNSSALPDPKHYVVKESYRTEYGFATSKENVVTGQYHMNNKNAENNAMPSTMKTNEELGENLSQNNNETYCENLGLKTEHPEYVEQKNTKKIRRQPGWIGVIVTALICGLLPSAYYAYNAASTKLVVLESHTKPNYNPPLEKLPPGKPVNWVEVAKIVQPSVVAIRIQTRGGAVDGSGVIIDKKGHIVTNYHVINQAIGGAPITVQMQGGILYTAKIVGYDSSTDLAVIKLMKDVQDIKPATLGTSRDLQVGEGVAAVGNPLGLASTVTTGIISALNRPVKVAVDTPDDQGELVVTNAIQVDASINPGNSGGPLFDATGRVIGINSSIASIPSPSRTTGGSIGLGFAIPVDLVKNIADQIITTGKVHHPMLGVAVASGEGIIDEQRYTGAFVRSVVKDSPAEKAGIEKDDLIIDIDGNRVVSDTSLRGFVRRYKKDDKALITLLRNGKEIQKEVVFNQVQ